MTINYSKVEKLAAGYAKAENKSAYLADIWGDLNATDAAALYVETCIIDKREAQ